MSSILILLSMTLFGSLGGFFFKKAGSYGKNQLLQLFLKLAIGGCFYLAGAILNILLLKELPYSIVFPLTSVTYIWTLLISYKFLNEKVTKRKVLGIGMIVIGCFLLIL